MEDRKLLGKLGEDLAAAMLYAEGFSILDRNFRSRYGEIDIVCLKNSVIWFTEVKTRTCDAFGEPEEAVNGLKQYRMRKTAEYYLLKNRSRLSRIQGYGEDPMVSFKVVEIMIRETDDSFLTIR